MMKYLYVKLPNKILEMNCNIKTFILLFLPTTGRAKLLAVKKVNKEITGKN